MPVDPSLTISIDRMALSLPPLVCSGKRDGSDFFLTDYAEPAMQAQVEYVPSSSYVHGDVPRGWRWQQTILPFSVIANATTEAEDRASLDELVAAISQGLSFEVTVNISDDAPRIWSCNPGSVSPVGSRTLANVKYLNDEWSVSLPCFPVRS